MADPTVTPITPVATQATQSTPEKAPEVNSASTTAPAVEIKKDEKAPAAAESLGQATLPPEQGKKLNMYA
ncbi:MAG: hypothetical protein WCY19_07715 [Candidatus Gastranaerophilaceae bacterium]